MAGSEPVSGVGPTVHVTDGLQLLIDVTVDINGLALLRSTVAAHVAYLGLDADQVGRVLMVATELVTNAIFHGGGTGRCTLWSAGPFLYCRVVDRGQGIPEHATGLADPFLHEPGGRGLWLIRKLSDSIEITGSTTGSIVTVGFLISDPTPLDLGQHLTGPPARDIDTSALRRHAISRRSPEATPVSTALPKTPTSPYR